MALCLFMGLVTRQLPTQGCPPNKEVQVPSLEGILNIFFVSKLYLSIHCGLNINSVFSFENTDALVLETYGTKKIELKIKGENIVKLSAIVTSELDYINSSYDSLKVEKLIPCNCSECEEAKKPHYYNYENLMLRKSRGKKKTIECVVSEENVDFLALLEGVYGNTRNFDASIKLQLDNIRKAVSKNDIDSALKFLEKVDEESYLVMSNRYKRIQKDSSLGIQENEEYYKEITKIGYDIIRTISAL